MHVVQVLLPIFDNDGRAFEQTLYLNVKTVFTEKFGGVTAYAGSLAEEARQGPSGTKRHDQIVIFEVMMTGRFESRREGCAAPLAYFQKEKDR